MTTLAHEDAPSADTRLQVDVEQGLKASLPETSRPMTSAVDSDDIPEWKVVNDYSFYEPPDYTQKEIRLVTIAAGTFDDPLHCTLTRHAALWDDIEFEALSYCWGDLQDTVAITLRHAYSGNIISPKSSLSLREQVFNVTKSLDVALRHLRQENRERVVWIDALCINQGSIRERNYAIPFMAEIYRNATCVIIFLGEEGARKNWQRIWQLMGMLKSAVERGLPALGLPLPLTLHSDIEGIVNCLNIEPKDGKSGDTMSFRVHMSLAFEEFFEYQWFQRVWVVQEAMNAKQAVVYCGDQKRDWVDVLVFLCMAVKSSQSYAGAWSGSLRLRDRLPPFLWTKLLAALRSNTATDGVPPGPRLPLLQILTHGRAFAATDPRDKVFALLSFGEETHDIETLPGRLKPDYGKSASEVWQDVTRQWIIDNESLDILGILREEIDKNNQVAQKTYVIASAASAPLSSAQSRFAVEQPPENHPSWAVWHAEHPSSAQTALFRLEDKLSKCNISIDLRLLDVPTQSNILSLRGMTLDAVKAVQWPFKRWTFLENDVRQFNYNHEPPTSVKDGVLVAWGSLIGLIEGVGSTDAEQLSVKTNAKISIPPYPSGKSMLQAFIETLICRRFAGRYFTTNEVDESLKIFMKNPNSFKPGEGKDSDGKEPLNENAEDSLEKRADFEAIAHFAAHWAASRNHQDMKWIPEPAAGVLRELSQYGDARKFTEMCQYIEGRCFFQLCRGAIGLCPRGTRAGDQVATLSGGRTPFVIRQLHQITTQDEPQGGVVDIHDATDGSGWTIVGECYVHDLDISRMTLGTQNVTTDKIQVFDFR